MHVYSNIVTVDVAKGYDSAGLADIVREMYRYWKPGVEAADVRGRSRPKRRPPQQPAGDGGDGGGPQLSAAAQKVPAHLLERSRAALAKWNAAHA